MVLIPIFRRQSESEIYNEKGSLPRGFSSFMRSPILDNKNIAQDTGPPPEGIDASLLQTIRFQQLAKECLFNKQQQRVTTFLAALSTMTILLSIAQVVLLDSSGYTKTVISCFNSFLILLQCIALYKYYCVELDLFSLRNPLWVDVRLLDSPLLFDFLLEELVLILHEPPFIDIFWSDAFKLNALVCLRAYLWLRVFRDHSFTQSPGARLVGYLGGVNVRETGFFVKAFLLQVPITFTLATSALIFFMLSYSMYVLERSANLSFGDSLWLIFAIVSTIGFGDITPQTREGKLVAVIAAMFGTLLTALMVTLVTKAVEVSEHERRVILFMSQASEHRRLSKQAFKVLTLSCRLAVLRRRKSSTSSKVTNVKSDMAKCSLMLRSACQHFRKSRNSFRDLVRSVHAKSFLETVNEHGDMIREILEFSRWWNPEQLNNQDTSLPDPGPIPNTELVDEILCPRLDSSTNVLKTPTNQSEEATGNGTSEPPPSPSASQLGSKVSIQSNPTVYHIPSTTQTSPRRKHKPKSRKTVSQGGKRPAFRRTTTRYVTDEPLSYFVDKYSPRLSTKPPKDPLSHLSDDGSPNYQLEPKPPNSDDDTYDSPLV